MDAVGERGGWVWVQTEQSYTAGNIYGEPQKTPRIGGQYQAEILSLMTENKRLQLIGFVPGSRNARRNVLEFGRTFVVMSKGTHHATIVLLHGISEKGSRSKWICPSAPTRQVTLFGGYPCTAWFNVESMSEDACDDLEGLDASATHVANLLSNEPDDVKLGIAGFSIGAAVALYSATCRAVGQYGNGNRYPINLSATVALSGWLPTSRNLRNRVGASQEAARRTASLPTLLCHGQVDDVVDCKIGEKSAQTMYSAGFQNLTFRTYNR
ncbi:Phospholipase/carboxylesterase/thioesterase [Cynara cardunculus var. scolymus]|uniref:Phospholipase/carboxylesterase/thioesterase n=1 Tax=Cynara cardunculus var. scolymus TaxID=59895 RepID=A0A103XGH1_CYNCS|nr:Phospholipase/carboxylesterase/thioesterase [Cynara cardunculus var. scolymus]